jgi:long-chain fatty acid transport protein
MTGSRRRPATPVFSGSVPMGDRMRYPGRRGLRALVRLAMIIIGLAPDGVLASGFQDRAGNPDWAANAFAGMAAKGYDASTAWTNPAAMMLLPRNEIEAGVSAVIPSTEFQGQNLVGPFPTPGSNGDNPASAAPTGSLAGVWSASPAFRLGVSAETPFGQRLKYPLDFVGRYQALVSSITDVEIGLVGAYRINQHLSLGAGPILDNFQARLTSAVNIGPVSNVIGDPIADVHGRDWSAGYHLGALYEFDWPLRIGVDYRSRIFESLQGDQEISIPPQLGTLSPGAAAQFAAASTNVHADIALPDVLTVSGVWEIGPQWSALATVQWTHWSLLQELSIIGDNGQVTVMPLQLRSTWLGSVGANYRLISIPGLMLQVGLGFDETPVTDSTRSPRLTGQSVVILGAGLSYDTTAHASVRAAFLRELGVGSGGVMYSANATAGELIGSYNSAVTVVGLGINWRF